MNARTFFDYFSPHLLHSLKPLKTLENSQVLAIYNGFVLMSVSSQFGRRQLPAVTDGAMNDNPTATPPAPRCNYQHCGKPLTGALVNRNKIPRQYCDNACRAMAYKMRNPQLWGKMGTPKPVRDAVSREAAKVELHA